MVVGPRTLLAIGGLWAALAPAALSQVGHQCFGFVGWLAHTPLHAFRVLSVAVLALGVLALLGRVRLPGVR